MSVVSEPRPNGDMSLGKVTLPQANRPFFHEVVGPIISDCRSYACVEDIENISPGLLLKIKKPVYSVVWGADSDVSADGKSYKQTFRHNLDTKKVKQLGLDEKSYG